MGTRCSQGTEDVRLDIRMQGGKWQDRRLGSKQNPLHISVFKPRMRISLPREGAQLDVHSLQWVAG